MPKGTCSLAGCDRPHYGRSFCRLHWKRWWKNGDPGPVQKVSRVPTGNPCLVDGCAQPGRGRGWCYKHYDRWKTHGDPTKSLLIHHDDDARLWSKVDQRESTECWPWLGGIGSTGYGIFMIDGRSFNAHRCTYESAIGPIPAGLTIDHVYARGCRRRDCVNPYHLEPVTQAENNRRQPRFQKPKHEGKMHGPAQQPGRKRQSHCGKGHAMTPDNVYMYGKQRQCRTCKADRQRASRAAAATPGEAA